MSTDTSNRKQWDKSKLPSRHVSVGPACAPHRSYYYAMGMTEEEIAQPFVGVNMVSERVLNIGGIPLLRLRLVKMIEYVEDKVVEARLVEGVSERFRDKLPCLRPVHLISNK